MKFFLVFIISWFSIAYANEVQDRTNSITKNLRCLVCEGQSVYESNSDFAKDIKTFITKKIKEKNTDEDIYDFLISKYGEEIILNPDFSKKYLLSGSNEGEIRNFFTKEIISFFEKKKLYHIESNGEALLILDKTKLARTDETISFIDFGKSLIEILSIK